MISDDSCESLLDMIFNDILTTLKDRKSRETGEKSPLVVSILGPQGSGKSTTARIVGEKLEKEKGMKVIQMSSDDFYLTYKERCALKEERPFVKYRGPPGTQDIGLINDVMDSLKKGGPVRIPIFDKSLNNGQGDRSGFSEYLTTQDVDVVIFEGWFNGLLALETPPVDSVD